jgi:hypothetical protein
VPERPAVRGDRTSGVSGEDAYTVFSESHRQYRVTVRVDLYNSEFGMGWLAKCATACEKEQAIKTIFRNSNIGFKEVLDIEDRTRETDERIYFHQRMTINFRTVITHIHKNYNFLVDDVDITGAISIE